MAVEVLHHDCIAQDSLSPTMTFLLTKWNSLAAMGKLTLQALTESQSFNVADNCAYMIPAGADFFFMHVGKNVQAAIGQDFTGRMLSSLNDTVANDLADAYRQAAEEGKPMFMRFTSSIAQNALVWERLVLPVPLAGLGTILVCYSEVLSHQQDVYAHLFRHARYPWIVTWPIFTAARELDDGWVLMMNDAARAAFGHERPIANLRLRELPLFQFGELWTRLRERHAVAAPRVTVAFERLEIELVRIGRLLAYRLTTDAGML
jgi:hypothetical protein